MRERHKKDRDEYISLLAKSSTDKNDVDFRKWMHCRASNSILDNIKRNGTSTNTNQDLLGIFNLCDYIFLLRTKVF